MHINWEISELSIFVTSINPFIFLANCKCLSSLNSLMFAMRLALQKILPSLHFCIMASVKKSCVYFTKRFLISALGQCRLSAWGIDVIFTRAFHVSSFLYHCKVSFFISCDQLHRGILIEYPIFHLNSVIKQFIIFSQFHHALFLTQYFQQVFIIYLFHANESFVMVYCYPDEILIANLIFLVDVVNTYRYWKKYIYWKKNRKNYPITTLHMDSFAKCTSP